MSGGRRKAARKRARFGIGAILAAFLAVSGAGAAEVSPADLSAALRALGFLSSLQNRSSVVIGVVYNGADPAQRALAMRVAGELARLNGPGSATVSAYAVPAQELSGQRLDAVYLLSLPPDAARAAGDFVRRQSVVSVSSDPQCLEAQTCVLMVQARSTMSVVLDTALAKSVGAKFSTVFTMLVKRR